MILVSSSCVGCATDVPASVRYCRTCDYDRQATEAAALGERAAMAVLFAATPQERADAIALLTRATHERDVMRDAAALARYRAGKPVAAWPQVAPWLGF